MSCGGEPFDLPALLGHPIPPPDTATFVPGGRVVLTSTVECGIVVWCSTSDELAGEQDCYVAFFGAAFPIGPPTEPPYVLRYAAAALRRAP